MTPRSLYTQFPLTEITYAKVCILAASDSCNEVFEAAQRWWQKKKKDVNHGFVSPPCFCQSSLLFRTEYTVQQDSPPPPPYALYGLPCAEASTADASSTLGIPSQWVEPFAVSSALLANNRSAIAWCVGKGKQHYLKSIIGH